MGCAPVAAQPPRQQRTADPGDRNTDSAEALPVRGRGWYAGPREARYQLAPGQRVGHLDGEHLTQPVTAAVQPGRYFTAVEQLDTHHVTGVGGTAEH
jgi:hypothetical protein